MSSTLRQRRKIVNSLYHDSSTENRIESHDSINASLRLSRLDYSVYYNTTSHFII